MSFIAGELLQGKFRIEEPINAGGIGLLYQCTDIITKKKYLMKTTSVFPGTKEFFMQNNHLRREIEMLKLLKGKISNISQIVDSFEANQRLCLILEPIEGKSLYEFVQTRNLTLQNISTIFEILISLVDQLHTNLGVVHGDINPKNIIINENLDVVLIDFGQSVNGIDSIRKKAIGERIIFGGYTAPEIIKNGEYSWAADIFGLGTILYFLLTRSSPEVEKYSLDPRRIIPNIPQNYAAAVSKCTRFNINKRPSGISELRLILKGEFSEKDTFIENKVKNIHATNSKIIFAEGSGRLIIRDFLNKKIESIYEFHDVSGIPILFGIDKYFIAIYPNRIVKVIINNKDGSHQVLSGSLPKILNGNIKSVYIDDANGNPYFVCIDSDGDLGFCMCSKDKNELNEQSWSTDNSIQKVIQIKSSVKHASIGRQGVCVITEKDQCYIKKWNPVSENFASFLAGKNEVKSFDYFQRNEKPSAVLMSDNRVTIGTSLGELYHIILDKQNLTLDNFKRLKTIHNTPIEHLAWLGGLMLSVTESHQICLWDINQLDPITIFSIGNKNIIKANVGGRCLVILTESEVLIYDLLLTPDIHDFIKWLKTLHGINTYLYDIIDGDDLANTALNPILVKSDDEIQKTISLKTLTDRLLTTNKSAKFIGKTGFAPILKYLDDFGFQREFKNGLRENSNIYWSILNAIFPTAEIPDEWSFNIFFVDFSGKNVIKYPWTSVNKPRAKLNDRQEKSIGILIELKNMSPWLLPLIDSINITVESDRGDIQDLIFNRLYYKEGVIVDQASFKLDDSYKVESYAILDVINISIEYNDALNPSTNNAEYEDIYNNIKSMLNAFSEDILLKVKTELDNRNKTPFPPASIPSSSPFPPASIPSSSPFPLKQPVKNEDFSSDETRIIQSNPENDHSDETRILGPTSQTSSDETRIISPSDSLSNKQSNESQNKIMDPLAQVDVFFKTKQIDEESGNLVNLKNQKSEIIFKKLQNSFKRPSILPLEIQIGSKYSAISKIIERIMPKMVLISFGPTIISWIILLTAGDLQMDSIEFMIQAIGYGILFILVLVIIISTIRAGPAYKKRNLSRKEKK